MFAPSAPPVYYKVLALLFSTQTVLQESLAVFSFMEIASYVSSNVCFTSISIGFLLKSCSVQNLSQHNS